MTTNTIKKRTINTLTISLIVDLMIKNESTLRQQIFYNCRKHSVDGGDFRLLGLKIKQALLSQHEREIYDLSDKLPTGHILLIAEYELQKNKKWVKHTILINNNSGSGTPIKIEQKSEEEFKQLLQLCEETANEIFKLIHSHWLVMKPLISDIIKHKQDEYRVFIWQLGNMREFIIAKSYSEVQSLLKSTEGIIRKIKFDDDFMPITNETRLCNEKEISEIFNTGDIRRPTLLKELVDEERDFNKLKENLIKKYNL
jgi:hypothetical protein